MYRAINIFILVSLQILVIKNIASAQIIYTIAGSGYNGNTGDDGLALCAGTIYPSDLCLDKKGSLYITCSNSIRKIDLTTGIITKVAGSDSYGHTGDGGPALNALLQSPSNLCMDATGNLYISERGGNYIRKINTNTGIISTVAGTGVAGFSGDGGPALSASLTTPAGLACDAQGNLYFADKGNSRIRKIDATTGVITTIAGTGATSYSGDGGPAINAGTPYPVDVSMDADGNIFFIEVNSSNTCRVRKIDKISGIITTVAGMSSYAYSGDGGPATSASLFDPSGLFVDGAGNIFISEYDDSRIRKVDATTGIINTIAGTGVNGFSGDGDPALYATLYYPMGIVVDDNGDIYFADNMNHRIRKISNNITTPTAHPAKIQINANTTVICPGTEVQLYFSALTITTNLVFKWYVNDILVQTDIATSIFKSNTLVPGDKVYCIYQSSICNNLVLAQSNTIVFTAGGNQFPEIKITTDQSTICQNTPVVFEATSENAGINPSFQWLLNGNPVGISSRTFLISSLNDKDEISCILTVDPTFLCAARSTATSNTISITVNSDPPPSISVTASGNNICEGTTINFVASAQNANNSPSYRWYINSTTVGNNQSTFTTNQLKNNDVVICELLSWPGSCFNNPIASTPIIMEINPVPKITLSPSDTTILPDNAITIKATIEGTVSSYTWSPMSSIIRSTSSEATTRFLNDDEQFTYSVLSIDGCQANAVSHIKVAIPFYMPTAFTPNNDGINDLYIIPPRVKIQLDDFSIFDRWGNIVFQTKDITKGWDGTQNGIKKDSGAFIYVIKGKDEKGKMLKKGTFILIR